MPLGDGPDGTNPPDEMPRQRPGTVYQIGVVPGRVDLLTELSGLAFADVAEPRGETVRRHRRTVHWAGRFEGL